MAVEKMTNYGKGVVELLSSPEYKKIEKQMFITILSSLWKEVGFIGLLKIMILSRSELQKMRKHDWSKIARRGVSKNIFEFTFKPIAMMKVLADLVGLEKAREIITEIYEKSEDKLAKKNSEVNLMIQPVRELKDSKDSFHCFKEYTKATENAMNNICEIKFIEDSKDALSWDVNYCFLHEVAKEYGNPAWCFPFCNIDDVVYPKIGEELGFIFRRSGTLSTGASKCDFRFERIL